MESSQTRSGYENLGRVCSLLGDGDMSMCDLQKKKDSANGVGTNLDLEVIIHTQICISRQE